MAYCHGCGKELPAQSAFCPACGTPVPGSTQPTSTFLKSSQPAQIFTNLATSGDRFVAVFIDTLILSVASLIFAVPIGLLGAFGIGFFPSLFFGTFTLLSWLVWLIYFSFFEGTSGQTLGKQAVGIKVVDETTMKPPPLEQALLRNILRIIDWLPFFYIIGFILVETQPNKKRLGNMVARTVVVRA